MRIPISRVCRAPRNARMLRYLSSARISDSAANESMQYRISRALTVLASDGPRIKGTNRQSREIFRVSRSENQAVLDGSCRDQPVHNRQWHTLLLRPGRQNGLRENSDSTLVSIRNPLTDQAILANLFACRDSTPNRQKVAYSTPPPSSCGAGFGRVQMSLPFPAGQLKRGPTPRQRYENDHANFLLNNTLLFRL